MYPRLFQFGHVAIPSYGVFAALALIAALALSLQTAKKLSLDPSKIWNLGLIGILSALFGSRLLLILFHPRDFMTHPLWMLGLVTIRNGAVLAAGILLSICICIGYIFVSGLPFRRTLDCLAPSLALGLAIRAIGALLAGSEYGTPTVQRWGIVYHHALATLWSGTPLGIGLHPVQAYEGSAFFLLFAILVLLMRRLTRDGDLAGGFLIAAGAIFYFLDFFRVERDFLFSDITTAPQLCGILLVLAGAALQFRPVTRRHADASV